MTLKIKAHKKGQEWRSYSARYKGYRIEIIRMGTANDYCVSAKGRNGTFERDAVSYQQAIRIAHTFARMIDDSMLGAKFFAKAI